MITINCSELTIDMAMWLHNRGRNVSVTVGEIHTVDLSSPGHHKYEQMVVKRDPTVVVFYDDKDATMFKLKFDTSENHFWITEMTTEFHYD